MTDPAAIAAGLTKAQRTALWSLGEGPPDFGTWRYAPFDGWRRSGQACSSLVKKGLAEKYVEDIGIFYRLNDAGLAVRAALDDTVRGEGA